MTTNTLVDPRLALISVNIDARTWATTLLVKLQKKVIALREKPLIIVEGRNGAGRDRLIKRDRKYIERWVLPASEIVSLVAFKGLPDGSISPYGSARAGPPPGASQEPTSSLVRGLR